MFRLFTNSVLDIESTEFEYNYSKGNGGIAFASRSTLTFTKCAMTLNYAV